ncbi:hypothetical protein [Bacillus sp. B1-b2]|uniref:hypothetical protein n=1 Tax=Bacillus sp. B1-b2 TaxID=2653201 RepID=UPI0012614F68|nr:hypothetical protein [Bacillus sp. B1-b2]KAB7668056.1 hypothetical protein F9279_14070 [Bacillus sp. B1-b2]
MDTNLHCRDCGSTTFAEGSLEGYAAVRPTDKIFSTGSPITVLFCKKCGEVVSMKVKQTEKFQAL